MSEKKSENALENVNKDYLEILYSKEYRLGKRIYKLKNSIRKFRLKDFIDYYKSMKIQKKVNKISEGKSIENSIYNKGKIIENKKTVVYSCITGKYDEIKDPILKTTDCVLITDQETKSKEWKKYDIPKDAINLKGNKINRYCKMHPFKIFKGYDFSIYIDGNVQVVSDVRSLCSIAKESKCGIAMHTHPNRRCAYIESEACIISKRGNPQKIREQMNKYRKEGFPENFGFCEATIIVCDLNNPVAKKIMNSWYEEFINSDSGRDQLAFPYVVWKNGYKIKDIGVLGNNLLYNPIFRVFINENHKN